MSPPWISDRDQTDVDAGILCQRADDWGATSREVLLLARALRWLIALP